MGVVDEVMSSSTDMMFLTHVLHDPSQFLEKYIATRF